MGIQVLSLSPSTARKRACMASHSMAWRSRTGGVGEDNAPHDHPWTRIAGTCRPTSGRRRAYLYKCVLAPAGNPLGLSLVPAPGQGPEPHLQAVAWLSSLVPQQLAFSSAMVSAPSHIPALAVGAGRGNPVMKQRRGLETLPPLFDPDPPVPSVVALVGVLALSQPLSSPTTLRSHVYGYGRLHDRRVSQVR